MRQERLVAKMIDLEERANAHTAEYLRLLHVPGGENKASLHYLKALRLRSKVQGIIRQIALCVSTPGSSGYSTHVPSDPSSMP